MGGGATPPGGCVESHTVSGLHRDGCRQRKQVPAQVRRCDQGARAHDGPRRPRCVRPPYHELKSTGHRSPYGPGGDHATAFHRVVTIDDPHRDENIRIGPSEDGIAAYRPVGGGRLVTAVTVRRTPPLCRVTSQPGR